HRRACRAGGVMAARPQPHAARMRHHPTNPHGTAMADHDPFEDAARRLTAAYARRLRDAGAPDPDNLARELVVMARGHGWRLVEALKPAVPAGDGRPAAPTVRPEVREALAACEQATQRFRAQAERGV